MGNTTIPHRLRRSPSGPGPSVAARHLPTLWGVTLYTREALRWAVGANIVRPQQLAVTLDSTGAYGMLPYVNLKGPLV